MVIDTIDEEKIVNEIEDFLYDVSYDREDLADEVMTRVNNLSNWINSAKIKLEKYQGKTKQAANLLNSLL